MAWLDPRIYAHPKLLRCSPLARWVYVAGLAYSDGFGTRGELNRSAQKLCGSTAKTRSNLLSAGLWKTDENDAENVRIHDWQEHNGRRDDARETRLQADRERKRAERAALKSARTSTGQSTGQSAGRPRARDARLLSTEREEQEPVPVPTSTTDVRATSNGERAQADDLDFGPVDYRAALASFVDVGDGAEDEPA